MGIFIRIALKRNELIRLQEDEQLDLSHPLLVEKSQELDRMLNQLMNMNLNDGKENFDGINDSYAL